MPGPVGGPASENMIPGIAAARLAGIASSVIVALTGATLSGFLLRADGAKQAAYDEEDFTVVPEPKTGFRARR